MREKENRRSLVFFPTLAYVFEKHEKRSKTTPRVKAIASRSLFSSRAPNIWKKRPRTSKELSPKDLATGYDLPTKDITDSPLGMEICGIKKKKEQKYKKKTEEFETVQTHIFANHMSKF